MLYFRGCARHIERKRGSNVHGGDRDKDIYFLTLFYTVARAFRGAWVSFGYFSGVTGPLISRKALHRSQWSCLASRRPTRTATSRRISDYIEIAEYQRYVYVEEGK